MFGALDIYLGACQYYIGIYPNIEDHAEILKAVIGANTSDNEQKIIGSEKTEMIHQNKKEKCLSPHQREAELNRLGRKATCWNG